jgi:ubiquinone/menaquinone biosynthesis C-methylase UbiE
MSLSAADCLTIRVHEICAFDPETSFVLDNGAGTGALTTTLKFKYPALRVLSADISPGMLKIIEEKRLPNTETLVLDASELNGPLGNRTFSHVFSTFMITYSPSPINTLREMHRVLRPGGVIGIGIWGEKNGPLIIWNAACQKLDPTFESKPLSPSSWIRPGQVEAALSEVGFKGVKSEIFPMLFEMEDADAFLHFWFESKNPMALKCINEWKGNLEPVKQAVREVLKEDYDDGKNIIIEAILATAIK